MINDSYSTCNTIRTLRIKTDKPLQTVNPDQMLQNVCMC